jgi:hypothetical protein
MQFSKPRLEGRALEHALSDSRSRGIRMRDGDAWHVIVTRQALDIKREMKVRVVTLLAELEEQGFTKVRAEVLVRPGGQYEDLKSIDLILRSRGLNEDCLIEVKWTRRSMDVAVSSGMRSYPFLQQCIMTGRWISSRRAVAATIYGTLVVTPSAWKLEIRRHGTAWKREYPQADAVPRARRSGHSGWLAYRGNAPPGSSLWPHGASHS